MEFIRVDIGEIEKLNSELAGTGKRINTAKFKDGFHYINADMLTDEANWGGKIKQYIIGCPKHNKDLKEFNEKLPK